MLELRERYEFHLVSDRTRDARVNIDQSVRRYQLVRFTYGYNPEGRLIGTVKENMPHILQRQQMEWIERTRRESVRRYGEDPLFELLEQLETQAPVDPFSLLRSMRRNRDSA